MREMYITAFGADAYPPAPDAHHSTVPFAAEEPFAAEQLIIDVVRGALRPPRGRLAGRGPQRCGLSPALSDVSRP